MAEKSNEELLDECLHEVAQRAEGQWDRASYQKARAAVLARMCGPGEVVVPKEPTPEMAKAYQKGASFLYRFYDGYPAMLAACPNKGGTDGVL